MRDALASTRDAVILDVLNLIVALDVLRLDYRRVHDICGILATWT